METVAGRLEGVLSIDADYLSGTAIVTYNPAQTSPAGIVEGINTQTFYRASLGEPGASRSVGDRGWLPFVLVGGVIVLAFAWHRRRPRQSPTQTKETMEEVVHG